jgi:hypothetical protein
MPFAANFLYHVERKNLNVYLTVSSYRMCTLVIEIFKFPTIVAIRELNQVFEVVSCKKVVTNGNSHHHNT